MFRLSMISVILFSLSCCASVQTSSQQIGFSEECDSPEGWTSGAGCSVSVEDGRIVLQTEIGSWTRSFPWKEEPWISIAPNDSWASKELGDIDLDENHFIVMKTDYKGTVCRTSVNGKEIQTTITTGVVAQDLAPLGIKGKGPVKISFSLLNNHTAVKIDYIRFVSKLDPIARRGLLSNPITLHEEHIQRVPYDGLEALNERAARPYLEHIPEEKAAFIDPGTGTRKWRMTATKVYENFNEDSRNTFSSDGNSFYMLGRREGRVDYHYDKDAFIPNETAETTSRYSYYWKWLQELYVKPKKEGENATKTFAILRKDNQTGEESEVTRIVTDENWAYIEWGVLSDDICTFAMRETPAVWIIYPNEKDPQKRLRKVTLPTRLKSFSYNPRTDTASFYRCYTYENMNYNFTTGEISLNPEHLNGHNAYCSEFQFGDVTSDAKAIVENGARFAPGDKIRLVGVWTSPPSTDYSNITRDLNWCVTNGTRASGGRPTETMYQHVMIDLSDGGTFLRACTYWTSYTNWACQTRSGASPDYTKICYLSDMLGDGDYYIAITRNPDAPRNLKASRTGDSVKLAWDKPEHSAELKGYNIYRSSLSGMNFVRINRDLVHEQTFTDTNAPSTSFYMVAMEENSGMEGYLSNEASTDYAQAADVTLFYDAANCEKTLPMRQVLGGGQPYYRYLRITKSRIGEDKGSVIVAVNAPKAGEYYLTARLRNQEANGSMQLPNGEVLPVPMGEWQWVQAHKPLHLSKGVNRIELSSTIDGDSIERVILSTLKAYHPITLDDRMTRRPSMPANLKASHMTPNSVQLAWDPSNDLDFDYWSVYVSQTPDFKPGNATVLQSGRHPSALDWGIHPDTTYYYKVIAYNKRGMPSPAANLRLTTAPMDVATIQAKPEGLTAGQSNGISYMQGNGAATYSFDVPADGQYYLWLKYSPRNPADGAKLTASLDGDVEGEFTVRDPSRLGRRINIPAGQEKWYLDRVTIGGPNDVYQLKQGNHQLKLQLPDGGPWISTVYVTNDASFTPDGYDPRVELNKNRN